MKLALDPVNHRYTLGRLVLPSVTQVLGSLRMGTPDYSGVDPEVVARAGQRGTEVHGIIRALAEGAPVRRKAPVARKGWKGELERQHRTATGSDGYVAAAQKFCSDTGFTIVRAEVMLHHPSYHYAGTVDCTGRFRDGSCVTVDWKTGELSPSCALQLVAYNAMLYLGKVFHHRRVAVKLCRDGTYRSVEYPMATAREDWQAFLAALACYNWKRKYERR
jgi:hypothetical protein